MGKQRNILRELGMMFIIGFVILTCIHYVSAVESLGTFKQGQIIRIPQTCSDATYINISSISYPNSSVAVSDVEMTAFGNGEFYYDFNFTDINGRYDVRGVSDGCEGTFVTYFDVTPSGFVGTLGFYFIILILSLGIIVFGISIRDPIITILGSLGLYFIGLYIILFGIDGFKDATYTWALGIIILFLAAYISGKSAWEMIID